MTHIIRSRSPVRISFAGGGTDVSPYTEKHGGAVVNAAINQYAYTTFIDRKDGKIILDSLDLNKRVEYKTINKIKLDGNLDLTKAVILFFKRKFPHFFKKLTKGFEIHTSCEIPPRSGLGSSAAMFASIIGIFNRMAKEYRIDSYEIAELAYSLEREKLKNAGGRQDQYASVFGGINFIEFKGHDFVRVNPLKIKEDYLLELESNLILINLGARSNSGDIINDQIKNLKNNKSSINATHKTKQLANQVKYSLIQGDFIKFGKLLDKGWQEKKKFSSKISNPELDNIYRDLKTAGAIGGKILGAGGGGHMLLYCKPGKKLHVLQKTIKLGLNHVPFTFDHKGLTTWTINGKYEF
ncbi:GHMP kinase [Candidatus Peregrinibacteria bacterium]|nr:GHMP kinase [Candidatus Peregrinibacteria bacterium]